MTEARARSIVRERAQGRCELCRRPANNFAHRKNRSQGGLWLPSNGILMCGSGTTGCHGWTTGHPAASADGGWRVPSHEDPLTIPAWLRAQHGDGWFYLDNEGAYTPLRIFGAPPDVLPPLATAA